MPFIQFSVLFSLPNQRYWSVNSFPFQGVKGSRRRESRKVLTFKKFADEILKCEHSNESYRVVLPCCTVYYAVQGGSNFWMKPLKFDHSYKIYWPVLSCFTVYYTVQDRSNFWVCAWCSKVWPFKWKLLSSTFLWCYLLKGFQS